MGDWSNTPAARPLDRRKSPVSPFVVACVPGTTRSTPTGCDCLAATPPRPSMTKVAMPRSSFYSGPTPRLQRSNHLPDQRQAPATKPAAEALPALVMPFASWVTWLGGVIPQASGRMCGLPPAIVSDSWRNHQDCPFRGSEHRSYPLPLDHRFSPLYGQTRAPKQRFRRRLPRRSPARAFAPFMVELFTPLDLPGYPSPVRTRLRLSPAEGSPRRRTLNEPALASRPEPRGRICSRNRLRTDFET